jgi:hypothetical protein
VDSTIWAVHGHHKQGACYGSTRQLGSHPCWPPGPTPASAARPPAHRPGRLGPRRRAVRGRAGRPSAPRRRHRSADLRADSGFGRPRSLLAAGASALVLDHRPADKSVAAAITAIPQAAWADIDYPDGGIAQVAETTLGEDRLIIPPHPSCRLAGQLVAGLALPRLGHRPRRRRDRVGRRHRRHAVCELAIRDLKDGAGLRHSRRGGSWPTPPGWSWARSRTPAGLDGHHRARCLRPAGRQDLPPPPAGAARPADPIGPPPSAASAQGLAMANQFLQALPGQGGAKTLPTASQPPPPTGCGPACPEPPAGPVSPPPRPRGTRESPSRHRARRRPSWRASTTLTQTRTKQQQWIQA